MIGKLLALLRQRNWWQWLAGTGVPAPAPPAKVPRARGTVVLTGTRRMRALMASRADTEEEPSSVPVVTELPDGGAEGESVRLLVGTDELLYTWGATKGEWILAGAFTRAGTTIKPKITGDELQLGGNLTLEDGVNLVIDTTTGTKIGTGPAQKLGFLGATPVVRQDHIGDPTDLATCIDAIKATLVALETCGLLKTS